MRKRPPPDSKRHDAIRELYSEIPLHRLKAFHRRYSEIMDKCMRELEDGVEVTGSGEDATVNTIPLRARIAALRDLMSTHQMMGHIAKTAAETTEIHARIMAAVLGKSYGGNHSAPVIQVIYPPGGKPVSESEEVTADPSTDNHEDNSEPPPSGGA